LKQELATIEWTARRMSGEMEFGFLFDRSAAAVDRLRGGREPGLQLLRPACLGGSPGELHRHREERHSAGTGSGSADRSRRWEPGGPDLLSGSMFEYLMPSLVMRARPAAFWIRRTG